MSDTTAGIGTHQTLPTSELNLFHKNPRIGNVEAIAGSLTSNGQYRPIVVNKGTHTGRPMEVLAGNHTLKAYRLNAENNPTDQRWTHIDCWVVDVDDDRASRIVLADNRTADLGTHDDQKLLELLDTLEGDFDGTGFLEEDMQDLLDALYEPGTNEEPEEETDLPKPPAICKPGDIWELGPHRLLIGDSTNTQAVEEMMHGDYADCIWTDPPYGVDYVGKTKEALTIQNDGAADLQNLLDGAFHTIVECAHPGSPVYIAHADTERLRFETAMRNAGILFRQNLIWVKNTIVMGRSDYHYKHEPILYGFTPNGNGRLGRGGDHWYGDNAQSTVFNIDKPARNADHPTMKPPALIETMIANSCPRGGHSPRRVRRIRLHTRSSPQPRSKSTPRRTRPHIRRRNMPTLANNQRTTTHPRRTTPQLQKQPSQQQIDQPVHKQQTTTPQNKQNQ